MDQLSSLGYTVGEYVGNGKGDTEDTEAEADSHDTEPVDNDQHESTYDDENFDEGSSENANPLLFFYDCETTGFSIYREHITEVAAKVVGVPLSSLSQPTFSSLVRTTRNISKKGKEMNQCSQYNF